MCFEEIVKRKRCAKHLDGSMKDYRDCRCTSIWLGRVLTNLNPGILLSLHTTPTSSLCLQSETPMPLDGHSAKVASLPVQWRLSNQMRPDQTKQIFISLPLGGSFPLLVETTKEDRFPLKGELGSPKTVHSACTEDTSII